MVIATFHRTSVMYRAAEQEETQDALRQALFLSINGIVAAMQRTRQDLEISARFLRDRIRIR